MIIGMLKNWRAYFDRPGGWEDAFAHLLTLDEATPEGETAIRGRDVFCRVMRYETRCEDAAVLECHRRYVDIQVSLEGAERMDWYPRATLTTKTPYDEDKDVEFFVRPHGAAPVSIVNRPGMFAVFFPEDAHMPQLTVAGQPAWVRKAVVKIIDRR